MGLYSGIDQSDSIQLYYIAAIFREPDTITNSGSGRK
jgi:hypothetical protein